MHSPAAIKHTVTIGHNIRNYNNTRPVVNRLLCVFSCMDWKYNREQCREITKPLPTVFKMPPSPKHSPTHTMLNLFSHNILILLCTAHNKQKQSCPFLMGSPMQISVCNEKHKVWSSTWCECSGPRPSLKTQTAGLCRLCFVRPGIAVGGVRVVICSLLGVYRM